ncbi:MAG: histone deacetylase family protein [Alphaproteobacteria bacterium]|nr:histone deacetylase family protein [Alphaproteobacteria bacterium]
MITIYSEDHRLQNGKFELIDGQLMPPFECPQRAENVLARVGEVGLGEVRGPDDFGLDPVRRVHAPEFVAFLRTAHDEWKAAHGDTDALPLNWPCRGFRQKLPDSIDGRLGYYSFDAGTPITAGTWTAITSSANVALTGAKLLKESGDHAVFSLCRPPGHHAARDLYAGYCFFNNVAVAAEWHRDQGAGKVAILDVDYHHGNGTQMIFYDRADVLFVSLHGHPAQEYPFFLGFEDETGDGDGDGFNANYPMRWGTGWDDYGHALDRGITRIAEYGPDVLLVSLGVDTFKKDPISHFKLESEDYLEIGRRIAGLGLPTQFVMEGGYAIDDIGVNTVNVLIGFEAAGC